VPNLKQIAGELEAERRALPGCGVPLTAAEVCDLVVALDAVLGMTVYLSVTGQPALDLDAETIARLRVLRGRLRKTLR
jgi:hypothetical protein